MERRTRRSHGRLRRLSERAGARDGSAPGRLVRAPADAAAAAAVPCGAGHRQGNLLGLYPHPKPYALRPHPHPHLGPNQSEMEQQTIVAAVRPLERFPLLAAAVKERLQQLLEEVVAECREKLEELVQEKESFFIDIGWPAAFVYPIVPLGVRVAGSDRWDGANKPVGPNTGGGRVGEEEWAPATGLQELKRYYGGVQEAAIKATPEKVHRWCVRAFEAQVAARLCSLDLRSGDADLLRDTKASSREAQTGETMLL